MRDVPAQPPESRREARPRPVGGRIISVRKAPAERTALEAAPAPDAAPAPETRLSQPVWGGMASAPPPTRDYRGPFGFLILLAGVVVVALGLLVYAATSDRRAGIDESLLEETQFGASGGGVTDVPDGASLRVDGVPFGATVRIDSDSVGTLPFRMDGLAPGDHLLTIESGPYAIDTLLTVAAGERSVVFLRLEGGEDVSPATAEVQPEAPASDAEDADAAPEPAAPTTGILRIVSRPSGATIRLDGTAVGTTPLALSDVQAGRHAVTASLAGYQERAVSVSVKGGQDETLRLALDAQAAPATLEVLARPWGTIYIDGVLQKRNTDIVFRAQVSPGTHEIRVVHPTFGTRTRTVTIGSGQSTMEVFDLTEGGS